MSTYTITSTKQCETIRGSAAEALVRALEIEVEYQPAFGVDVTDERGATVYFSAADTLDAADLLDADDDPRAAILYREASEMDCPVNISDILSTIEGVFA